MTTTRTATSPISWSGCRRSRRAVSKNSCRIGGNRCRGVDGLANNEEHETADRSIGYRCLVGVLHLHRLYPDIRYCAATRTWLPKRRTMALLRALPADHVDRRRWTIAAGKKITSHVVCHDMVPAGSCNRSIPTWVWGRDVAGQPEKQCVFAGRLPFGAGITLDPGVDLTCRKSLYCQFGEPARSRGMGRTRISMAKA